MQFDLLTSNPAFNIAHEGNKAGTGGNSTLYRTATRDAFNRLLAPNGILLNITLKGMIPDLVHGHFKHYQVHNINLMDDIDVWPYNTCYFFIEKEKRTSNIKFSGGLSSKIYTPYEDEQFPFVYYSGSNKKMNKFFSSDKPNRVIRELPGNHGNDFIYDCTDKKIDRGWKFAFNVMESKKSYTVTDEPIYGGTICYIPTKTREDAERLKLFVLNNPIFKKYVNYGKFKYFAFALRNVKSFDLSQIVTGHEFPKEWNITESDLREPEKLFNEVVENRNKVKLQGQVYTPFSLVEKTFNDLELLKSDAFKNSKYTFCDTMCGNGKFLYKIVERKIKSGISHEQALKTVYGTDLDSDSIQECKELLLMGNEDLRHIVEQNIVCADGLRYHYRFDGSHPYDDEIQEKQEQEIFNNLLEF
jgi:hypothetical protein